MTGFLRPVKFCGTEASHSPHWWGDATTWAGGANVAVYDCPGSVRLLDVIEAHNRAARAEAKLAAVEALLAHARKISPSPSMHVYVADLEAALGLEVARPHKLGSSG